MLPRATSSSRRADRATLMLGRCSMEGQPTAMSRRDPMVPNRAVLGSALVGRSGAFRAARETGEAARPEVCCRPMLCRSHGRPGEIGHRNPKTLRKLCVIAATFAGICVPTVAEAAPGVANRLGGANAQGPASSSVTDIYHNAEMLGSVTGFRFESTLRTVVDHL